MTKVFLFDDEGCSAKFFASRLNSPFFRIQEEREIQLLQKPIRNSYTSLVFVTTSTPLARLIESRLNDGATVHYGSVAYELAKRLMQDHS